MSQTFEVFVGLKEETNEEIESKFRNIWPGTHRGVTAHGREIICSIRTIPDLSFDPKGMVGVCADILSEHAHTVALVDTSNSYGCYKLYVSENGDKEMALKFMDRTINEVIDNLRYARLTANNEALVSK